MNDKGKLSQSSLRKLINTSKLVKMWTFLKQKKKTFLERCDNDLNLDRQTDRWTWWKTKRQLSLECTAGHLLVSSHSTACPPSPPFQNNSNSVFKCTLFVKVCECMCVCLRESEGERERRKREREDDSMCLCLTVCVRVSAWLTDTVLVCV